MVGKVTIGPRAAHDSGPRRADWIQYAVIHTAEAADESGEDRTAEGVAAFFARPTTQASTQLAVDRDSVVRMLPDLVIPWGASGGNRHGVHVEICGRAAWTRQKWMTRPLRPMLELAAEQVAAWCYAYRLPARWVSVPALRAGTARGLTTHVDVNAAFKQGTHWDPGPGFPRDLFLQLVQRHLATIRKGRA